MLALPTCESPVRVDALTRIATACRDRRCLDLDYRDHQGRASRRRVEPMHLASYGRRWYLIAWDRHRGDWRTFRVDRVDAVAIAGEDFVARRLPTDPATFLDRAFALAPYRYQLRVRVDGDAAAVAARVPRWCGVMEPGEGGGCVLALGAETLDALAAQLLMANVRFRMMDAPPFADELRAVVERLREGLAAVAQVPQPA